MNLSELRYKYGLLDTNTPTFLTWEDFEASLIPQQAFPKYVIVAFVLYQLRQEPNARTGFNYVDGKPRKI